MFYLIVTVFSNDSEGTDFAQYTQRVIISPKVITLKMNNCVNLASLTDLRTYNSQQKPLENCLVKSIKDGLERFLNELANKID